jgi:hypothetical protein
MVLAVGKALVTLKFLDYDGADMILGLYDTPPVRKSTRLKLFKNSK